MIWLFAGSSVTRLAAVAGGMALLSGPLNNPQTWVAGHSPDIPPKATRLTVTANAFRIPTRTRGIVLDIENWPFTPAFQKAHPVQAYAHFYQVASKHHWIVGTPAFDLVRSMFPDYRGRIYPAFIRLDLAGRIAPYVSVYEIQAQGAERRPRQYASLVRSIAAQVKSAHPHVIVLAGLSTNPSGQQVSVAQLRKDEQLTQSMVRGYAMNIPQSSRYCPNCGAAQPQKAVRVLNAIYPHRIYRPPSEGAH